MELYSVRISDISEEKLNELCSLIDSEKKYKIEKLICKKDIIRTLIGDLLIRTKIFETLKLRTKYIRFNKNEYGKPYLEEYPDFNFNISHSGDYVLCAIDDQPIGIDVEEIKHIECKDVVNRFFTINESEYIYNQEFNLDLNRFYEIWTLKESYIKCCGQGLSIPLSSFSVEKDQNNTFKISCNNEYKQHILRIFDIEPGYKAAVCSINKTITNNIITVNQNSLIHKYCRICDVE